MQIRRAFAATTVGLLAIAGASCSSDDADPAADDADATSSTRSGVGDPSTPDGDGDATSTVALPDDWPAALALPADTTLLEVNEMAAGSVSVVARIDGEAVDVHHALLAQLEDADYEIVGSTFTPSDQGGFGSISAKNAERTVAISFGPDPTGDTSQVTISVANVAT